jgi:hypothetical protein
MSEQEEVEEHVREAREPFDKVVAGSMAIIAAFLAVVTVLGQHYNTEKLLNQQLASDQWAYYQAKDTRHYEATVAQDELAQLKADPKTISRYAGDAKKYEKQLADIKEKAGDFEKERDKTGHEAERFHLGEIFLEIGIVFSSLSILFKQRGFYFVGLGTAIIGIVVSVTGYLA